MGAIQETNISIRLTYLIRNLLNKEIFNQMSGDLGTVLDIGGGSFYKNLNKRTWNKYIVLEPTKDSLPPDDQLRNVESLTYSDEIIPLPDNSVDTVFIIQVLQFIFNPIKLISETKRVLRANGRIFILVPQSGNLHGIPYHYHNFTRFWLEKIFKDNSFEIIYYKAMGGAWRTIASRIFLMFWPVLGHKYYSDPRFKSRGILFWISLPFQFLTAVIIFPLALVLSFFDIKEEANNHFMIGQKIIK